MMPALIAKHFFDFSAIPPASELQSEQNQKINGHAY
jgi:hypothetical protein